MATAPSPNDLTRQQLDELDALLQKMLALPVNKPDPAPLPKIPALPEPDPLPGGWRADQGSAPLPHLPAAAAPAEPPAAWAALPAVFELPPPQATLEPAPEPLPAFGPPSVELPPEPTPPADLGFGSISVPTTARSLPDFGPLDLEELRQRIQATEPPAPQPAAAPLPPTPTVPSAPRVGLSPLGMANAVIEGVLHLFGPPGRLLTCTPMKYLLGFAGLVMLVAAGAWTAHGYGVVRLPVEKLPLDQLPFKLTK